MLVEIDDAAHLALARQLLRAHEYLTLKNLAVDLVIINESSTSYVQDLQAAIESLARASQLRLQQGARPGEGSVFALRAEGMSPESRLALLAAARVALVSRRGTLAEQLDRLEDPAAETAAPEAKRLTRVARAAPVAQPTLELSNGTGGFAADGGEYAVRAQARCDDAYAMDQRHRSARIWLPGVRHRQRLYVGREQPRERADALVE